MSSVRQEQASEILVRLQRQNKVGTPKSIAFVLHFLYLGGTTIPALKRSASSHDGITEKDVLHVIDLLSLMGLVCVNGNDLVCSQGLLEHISDNPQTQLDWFIESFIEYALISRIIDIEYISYNIELKRFIMSKGSIKAKNACFRNLLCDFEVIQRLPDASFVICDKLDRAIKKPEHHRRISQEQLMKQLQKNQEQGDRGEDFVVAYEKQRITDTAKHDKIQRISIIDVTAGFDVVSFNSNESEKIDRFIEVKTFSGSEHFYWSYNEIKKAKLMGDDYYLYLVDDDCIDKIGYEPHIIQNPIVAIGQSDEWIKKADSLYVEKVASRFGDNHLDLELTEELDWTINRHVGSDIKLVNAIETIESKTLHISAAKTNIDFPIMKAAEDITYNQADETWQCDRQFTPNAYDKYFHQALDMEHVKIGIYRVMNSKGYNGQRQFDKVYHWFVVLKVLREIDWIDDDFQNKDLFEWLQTSFGCTFKKGNYDKVDSLYKETATKEWKENMPHGKSFVDLAAALRRELRGNEDKYKVRPELYIWHPSEEKNN